MSLIQLLKHLVLAPEVLSLCALHPSVCLPAATLKLIQSCNMHFLVLRLSFNTKESVFPPCRINYFVHYLFFHKPHPRIFTLLPAFIPRKSLPGSLADIFPSIFSYNFTFIDLYFSFLISLSGSIFQWSPLRF